MLASRVHEGQADCFETKVLSPQQEIYPEISCETSIAALGGPSKVGLPPSLRCAEHEGPQRAESGLTAVRQDRCSNEPEQTCVRRANFRTVPRGRQQPTRQCCGKAVSASSGMLPLAKGAEIDRSNRVYSGAITEAAPVISSSHCRNTASRRRPEARTRYSAEIWRDGTSS